MTVSDRIKTSWSQRPAAKRRRAALDHYEATGYWPRTKLQKIGERIGDGLGEIWTAVWRRGR